MKFSTTSAATWFLLFTLRTVSPQNIGEVDTEDSNIVGGTDSVRVLGYVASGPGLCGGQLIHPDVVVRRGLTDCLVLRSKRHVH